MPKLTTADMKLIDSLFGMYGGYAFERFLKRWFDVWGLDARGSFKLIGEQIDGSFEIRFWQLWLCLEFS